MLIELAPREIAVLELLLKYRGTLVGKERLIDQLSSWDSELTFNALDIAVHRLRKKLKSSGFNIRTLRKLGYVID
jgi:two-component system, OmpR family, response regulator